MSGVDRLVCPVMPYAWGSRTAIAELCGRASPSDTPEAELWMGAHPRGAARLTRGGVETDLLSVVTAAPEAASTNAPRAMRTASSPCTHPVAPCPAGARSS